MIHLDLEKTDSLKIAVLRMAHGKVNAIDFELLVELERRLDEIAGLDDVRAIILTGSGKSFSAGVDLPRLVAGGADYVAELLPQLDRSLRRLYSFPRPTIAALNGHAIAGGLVLALACDRRLAPAEGPRFGLSEINVGVPFPVAAFEVVRAALPAPVARDLVLSGRLVTPPQAREIGAVDDLVPAAELAERALDLASGFGGPSPAAYAATKALLQAPVLERMERYSADFDARAVEQWSSETARDHVRSFLEALAGDQGR